MEALWAWIVAANMDAWQDRLELIARGLTIIGAPLAVWIFHRDNVKARRQREYETYHSLDERYLRYLEMCLDHPELDVFDVGITNHPPANEGEKTAWSNARKEMIALTMLISILERAFLLYDIRLDDSRPSKRWGRLLKTIGKLLPARTGGRESEAKGWREYMQEFAARGNFQAAWESAKGVQFERKFAEVMEAMIAEAKRGSSSSDAGPTGQG